MKTIRWLFVMLWCLPLAVAAQEPRVAFSHAHGYYDSPFALAMSCEGQGEQLSGVVVRYTLDGSQPTAAGDAYVSPLSIEGTTVLRAALFVGDERVSPVTTATYLFLDDVMRQSNTPKGYPATWGAYTSIWGTAQADYEMDPEMTRDAVLGPKIRQGLRAIPTLSLVTDRDGLFGHEPDSARGGIYVFTGAPVGDGIGRGWERHMSMELFDGTAGEMAPDGEEAGGRGFDVTVDCGLKLHGGHGRLAEKNPKHSFRLLYKKEFGAAKLDCPVFCPGGADKFDKLVLRCMFGNSWQHWDNDSRKRAQYERDTWMRSMQGLMGHPASRVQYVNLFLNGMYWGLYNLAERVDDDYCSSNFGGRKSQWDVVHVEEDHESHVVEASEGNMEKWNAMIALANRAATQNDAYFQLTGCDARGNRDPGVEPLLDVDNFIDYMLLNQYGGNTDWDVHNWLAFRNRELGDCGFRFVCWDSEVIFESATVNVLDTYNENSPTHIFSRLIRNKNFLHRYMDRAYKHLAAPGGWLTEERVVEVWDSLYHIIALPLYAEAARWGDYRRDVHPYRRRGELYTVDHHYMAERQRLLTEYFPSRSATLIGQLKSRRWYSSVDVPQMCLNGEPLTEGTDTLTPADVLTFANQDNVYFTVDGCAPVTWAASQEGAVTPTACQYANGTNVLDGVDLGTAKTLTVKAIAEGSTAEWGPMVERTFVIDRTAGIASVRRQAEADAHATYDLQGRRMADGAVLRRGVYVRNGRKVMVR